MDYSPSGTEIGRFFGLITVESLWGRFSVSNSESPNSRVQEGKNCFVSKLMK